MWLKVGCRFCYELVTTVGEWKLGVGFSVFCDDSWEVVSILLRIGYRLYVDFCGILVISFCSYESVIMQVFFGVVKRVLWRVIWGVFIQFKLMSLEVFDVGNWPFCWLVHLWRVERRLLFCFLFNVVSGWVLLHCCCCRIWIYFLLRESFHGGLLCGLITLLLFVLILLGMYGRPNVMFCISEWFYFEMLRVVYNW